MQLLLANQQVDVNSANNAGNTALHIAAVRDNAESIKMLLAHPQFNLANHANTEGRTPAIVAALITENTQLLQLNSY